MSRNSGSAGNKHTKYKKSDVVDEVCEIMLSWHLINSTYCCKLVVKISRKFGFLPMNSYKYEIFR